MKLRYDEAGAGPTVVLIHGHPFNRTMWAPQLGALSAHVIAPDLRGYGESPLTPGTVSMRELADDIWDTLDAAGLDRVAVVGMSMGGPDPDPAVVASVHAMMERTRPAGAAAAMRGRVQRPDYRPILQAVRVPAFVCVGDHDTWSTADVTAELIGCLRDPHVLVLEGVGHMPNLERPDAFNEALETFLHGR